MKDKISELLESLQEELKHETNNNPTRAVSIAKTHIETAALWYGKHVKSNNP